MRNDRNNSCEVCSKKFLFLLCILPWILFPWSQLLKEKQDHPYLKNTFLNFLEIIGVGIIAFCDFNFDLIDIIIDAV